MRRIIIQPKKKVRRISPRNENHPDAKKLVTEDCIRPEGATPQLEQT
jgi:hypothetical protein